MIRKWMVVAMLTAMMMAGAWLFFADRDRGADPHGKRAGPALGTGSMDDDDAGQGPSASLSKTGQASWAEGEGSNHDPDYDAAEALDFDPYSPGLTEEWIEYEKLSGDLLSPEVPMKEEAVAWRAYMMISTNPAEDAAERGRRMLEASSSRIRYTGALWILEEERYLDPAVMDRVLADPDPVVPLTVLGWMMDAGLDVQADLFEQLWISRADWTGILDELAGDEVNGMAARAALRVAARAPWSEEDRRILYEDVLVDPSFQYDARWKAAMLLREGADFEAYREQIDSLVFAEEQDEKGAKRRRGPPRVKDEVFETAMWLLIQRLAGPPDIAGSTPVLTSDDADLFFNQESSLMIEHVAIWVEAVVDDGLAQAQPGFADALERHLEGLPREELPANQLLALRRIESRLDDLRERER